MLKSILSMFGSLGFLIVRLILVIASVVGVFILAVNAFSAPSGWGRALCLLGALACAALFVALVWAGKNREEPGEPPEDDRRA